MPFASGSGAVEDPYIITNVHELQAMNQNLSAHYALGNDIDATDTVNWNGGEGFEPVGVFLDRFSGSFDGRGYIVVGLYINRTSARQGLFGSLASTSAISNACLEYVNITGGTRTGGLAGENSGGIIETSYTSGTVHSTTTNVQARVGGLVGLNDAGGVIRKCYSICDVSAPPGTQGGTVGGLVGGSSSSSSAIEDSYSGGTVSGWSSVGGLIGSASDLNISRCYSTAIVSATGTTNVGGLVGFGISNVVSSYWDTETSGQQMSAGGTSKTTAEMMQEATFVDWDFDDVWYIDEGNDYPRLRWELPDPPVATPISPVGGVKTGFRPTLEWSYYAESEEPQTNYHIQIETQNGDPVYDTGEIASNQHTWSLDFDLPNGGFRWRVRVNDDSEWGKWGDWSDWAVFRTPDPPTATPSYPVNIKAGVRPTFSWDYFSESGNPQTAYRVQVRDAADAIIHDSGEIESSDHEHAPNEDLPVGPLEWRVRVSE